MQTRLNNFQTRLNNFQMHLNVHVFFLSPFLSGRSHMWFYECMVKLAKDTLWNVIFLTALGNKQPLVLNVILPRFWEECTQCKITKNNPNLLNKGAWFGIKMWHGRIIWARSSWNHSKWMEMRKMYIMYIFMIILSMVIRKKASSRVAIPLAKEFNIFEGYNGYTSNMFDIYVWIHGSETIYAKNCPTREYNKDKLSGIIRI